MRLVIDFDPEISLDEVTDLINHIHHKKISKEFINSFTIDELQEVD